MVMQAVTLNLPHTLYESFSLRAKNNHRTVEAELLEAVTIANQWEEEEDELPAGLEQELASLALLDDNALWRAARSHMSAEAAAQAETLNHKLQREGLTKAEFQTLDDLTQQYERYMLIRAEAAVLLMRRGHDISELGPKV